ncbi:hypothetical protein [Kitasatospora sp. NPDC059327]|uniref:hypothetical protein n=1 Tax=Kitasatospora sp. NPDC059327 TaxID=3346803 RepID=UPI0036B9BBB0
MRDGVVAASYGSMSVLIRDRRAWCLTTHSGWATISAIVSSSPRTWKVSAGWGFLALMMVAGSRRVHAVLDPLTQGCLPHYALGPGDDFGDRQVLAEDVEELRRGRLQRLGGELDSDYDSYTHVTAVGFGV